jgi:hypothetical protein
MTLPSSGSISTTQIENEIGVASISIPDANTRQLTGKSTGALVMPTDFYGKSWGPKWTPRGGTYSDSARYPNAAYYTISCSETATWTYSSLGLASASVSNGGSATSITFSLQPSQFQDQSASIAVSSTASGNTQNYTIQLNTTGIQ